MRKISMRSALFSCAAALVVGGPPAVAQDYSNFIVFGDSLVDTGQYPDPARFLGLNPALPETSRLRFTNRLSDGLYGQPYSQVLASDLGFGPVLPSQPISIDAATAGALGVQSATSTANGLNYGVGGQTTDQVRSSIDGTPSADGGAGAITRAGIVGLPSRFDGSPANDPFEQDAEAPAFLNSADAAALQTALVLVSAGGNDIRGVANVALTQTGGIAGSTLLNAAQVDAAMQASAANTVAAVQALVDNGAGLVIVPNLPDIGKIPENAVDIGAARQAVGLGSTNPNLVAIASDLTLLPRLRTQGTLAYNRALAEGLAGVGGNVLQVDFKSFFDAVVANPGKFGFNPTVDHSSTCYNGREVTLIACQEDPTFGFNSGVDANGDGINDRANPFQFVFNDGIHPTTAAHAATAQFIEALMQAPGAVSVAPLLGLGAGRGVSDAAEDQLTGLARGKAGIVPFVSAGLNYAQYDGFAGNPRQDNNTLQGVIGATYNFGNGAAVGAGLGYQMIDGESAGEIANFDGNSLFGVLYGGMDKGRFFGNASATYGKLDYDIDRITRLRSGSFTNSGSTDGDVFGLTAEAGARLYDDGGLSVGPMVSLEYWKSEVDGYTEGGDTASALRIGDFDAESLRGGVGAFVEAHGTPSGIPMFFRAEGLYSHEFEDDAGTVTANSANGIGAGPAFRGQRNGDGGFALDLQLGATVGRVITSIGYDLRLGDIEEQGVRLNLALPL